jgi:hypothetical protein
MCRRAWLLLTILLLAASTATAAAAGYSPSRTRAAAGFMQELGILRGRPLVGLVPNETLTRAEMVTMLVRAMGREPEALRERLTAYPDTAGHWANGYIAVGRRMLAERGLGLGYQDGLFRPDDAVTAVEMVALLLKFLDVPPQTGLSWPDNYLAAAASAGILEREGERFCGEEARSAPVTRGCLFYHADRSFRLVPVDTSLRSVYERYHGRTVRLFRLEPRQDESLHFVTHSLTFALTGSADPTAAVTAVTNGMSPVKVSVTPQGGWTFYPPLSYGMNRVEFKAAFPGGRVEQVMATVEVVRR